MPSKQGRSTGKPQSSPQKLGEWLYSFVKEILLLAACLLFINSFVLAGFEVPTASMEACVKVGDRLFVNKFIFGGTTPFSIPLTSIRIPHIRVPGFRSVRRGDVIVFDWPGYRDEREKPPQTWYLKRCIALAGDTIQIANRVVYVNGQVSPNPPLSKFLKSEPTPPDRLNPSIFPRGSAYNEDNFGPLIVPKKGMALKLNPLNFTGWEVFIHREGHLAEMRDGKVFIDGRLATEYIVERDYAFGMGDNRDNSLDSRFWGFIRVEDIIGTPMIVYWSWDLNIPLSDFFNRLASIEFRRIGKIIY